MQNFRSYALTWCIKPIWMILSLTIGIFRIVLYMQVFKFRSRNINVFTYLLLEWVNFCIRQCIVKAQAKPKAKWWSVVCKKMFANFDEENKNCEKSKWNLQTLGSCNFRKVYIFHVSSCSSKELKLTWTAQNSELLLKAKGFVI